MSLHYISRENLKKFSGKTALVRVDLNIEPGAEKNSFRLEAILPTVRLLLSRGAKIIILSHRGRPARNATHSVAGGPRGYKKSLSLRPFVGVLEKELRQKVGFLNDFKVPKNGKVFLTENLRFWKSEEGNDAAFTKKLARLGDFYVNDAFAVSHRKNASVVAITRYLPSYAGLLFEKELKNLSEAIKNYRHPFIVISGGAKAEDKLGIIEYFWNKADRFLFGGGPANTFLAGLGLPVGNSVFSKETIPKIKKYLNSTKIILPIDLKIADKKILDIGSQTVEKYSKIISKSRTIIWNGPMGLFERRGFETGTAGIWRAILKNKKAKIIVGGGETTASLKLITNYQLLITRNKNIFVSTGGGAMLEFLSGKKLPGIAALEKSRASLAPKNRGGKH